MAKNEKTLVFLSHSSRDKAFVKRLNSDLKSRNIETWLDDQNIPLGGSITDSIQRGLAAADVVLIFLSEDSVASRWVSVEWQSQFFRQISENNTVVVPVLINDCQIPGFLADRRYVDFRKKADYEENLSHLLSFLIDIQEENSQSPKEQPYNKSSSILEITNEILSDLDLEQISLPVHKRMPIIDVLKNLQRSGKKVRLEKFKGIRIRSIYDHLLSLAHLADCLLPYIDPDVYDDNYADIAFCIAYHELNEVVLGDIPVYTSLSVNKRNTARIYAEERLRTVAPAERKRISNEFIWMFLTDKHRRAFDATNKILCDVKSKTYIAFKTLDKIDPIVATWRYLNHYRGNLGENPRDFNTAMKDFYENPDVRAFLRANNVDHKIIDFAANLQDRRKAWDYYEDSSRIFGQASLFEIPVAVAQNAIEGIPLFAD